MSNTENEWYYDYILETISSPQFRNPIKDFIDKNCYSFVGSEENSLEQGNIFKKFTKLVDNLLEKSLTELGITEEMFCLAAKKGLENPVAKKYFEQLISFTNYNYFKSLMTKRNIQLEEMAMSQMNGEPINNKKKKKNKNDPELQEAIKMSLAVEEEKRKLKALEERELKRAIKMSLINSNQNPVVESYKKKTVPSIVENKPIQQSVPIKSNESLNPKKPNLTPVQKKEIQNPQIQNPQIQKKEIQNPQIQNPQIQKKEIQNPQIQKKEIQNPQIQNPQIQKKENQPQIEKPKPIQQEQKDLIDEDETKEEKPIFDEEIDEPVNPIDKVIQRKNKQIPDTNIQYEIGKKTIPQNTKGTLSSTLNKNLNDFEAEKVRKLREYREMLLSIEREKRKKKEELQNSNNMSDENKRRLALRMQLAEKLKKQNLEKNYDNENENE